MSENTILRTDSHPQCSHCKNIVDQKRHLWLSWFFALVAVGLMYPSFCHPILSLEKLGERQEASLIEAIVEMYKDEKVILATFILVCSFLFPVIKNICLLLIGSESRIIGPRITRWLYSFVEYTGPWGKLEILITAVVLVWTNFGSEIIRITIEPALLPFTAMVASSMTASWLHK